MYIFVTFFIFNKMAKNIRPQNGGQMKFVRSNVDVAFFGGTAAGGKTFGAMLAIAEYANNPNFRACFMRKSLGELSAGGGLIDELKALYTEGTKVTESKTPTLQFASGARVTMTHVNNEAIDSFRERVKGWQYDWIYFDELTAFQFTTFSYFLTRNRGKAGIGGKIRGTTNPKRNSWVRKWLDWYIGDDGQIIPERDGVVRYFMIKDQLDVNTVSWGNTKEEVYEKNKEFIDNQIAKSKGKSTYHNFIKSFVFYKGTVYENDALLESDPNYVGSLASSGDIMARQLLDGDWNVDEEDYKDLVVSQSDLESMFVNDPSTMESMAITADIALGGGDNMIIMAWRGLHCIDCKVLAKATVFQALSAIREMQNRYYVPDSRIVFDGISIGEFVGGAYGVISGAIPFKSNTSPIGIGKNNYSNIKAQCAEKLIALIKQGQITFEDRVANMSYSNSFLKNPVKLKYELMEEFRALRFEEGQNNKRKVLAKKKQRDLLGGRSPDILDNLIYLMYFYLDFCDESMDEYSTNSKRVPYENTINYYLDQDLDYDF